MNFIKITLNKTKEEMVQLLEKAPNVLKRRLFDIENEIKDVTLHKEPCVIFMTPMPHQELEVMQLYKSLGVDIKIEDLTMEAIYGFYKTTDADVIEAKETEWQFDQLVNEFILTNADRDNVLDKISLYGMESITETDRSFLK